MKISKLKLGLYLLSFLLCCGSVVSVNANDKQPPLENLNVDARSAMVVDASSGQILYSQNPNQKVPIASVSKLVTTYVLLEQIKEKRLHGMMKLKLVRQSPH